RDHGLADGVGALDVHVALADLDDQVDRAGGLELVLGHGYLLVREGEKGWAAPPGRRPAWQGAYRGSSGWRAGGQTQPDIRRPRFPPNGPCPPNGSFPPTKGRLDRSMSTLMAFSRVAARTTLTNQVLREWPERAANSSALALTDSGSRSVIRAMPPSSSSSALVGGGVCCAAWAGGAAGASTTNASSRPSRRTSTLPVGISAVISL